MTEEQFLEELYKLVETHRGYRVDRRERDGDIILRRTNEGQTSARAQNIAMAFKMIMAADLSKKPRGGGWI
jgi:hypothetical protein